MPGETGGQSQAGKAAIPFELLSKLAELYGVGQSAAAYQLALKAEPLFQPSADLQNLIAVLSIALNEQERAVKHFQSALQVRPDFAEVCGNLGNLLRELGRLDESAKMYERALALLPQNSALLSGYANVLAELGDKEQAYALYKQAVALNPDYAEGFSNLGNICLQLGRQGEGLEVLRRALEINPAFAEAHNNIANILKGMGDPDPAIRHFREAIRYQPGLMAAYSNLGNFLLEIGDGDGAVTTFEKALEFDPKAANIHAGLGHYYDMAGKPEKASMHYKAALEFGPDSLSIRASQLHQQAMTCHWDEYAENSLDVLHNSEFAPVITGCPPPFPIMTLFDDSEIQYRASANYAQFLMGQREPVEFSREPLNGRRIRIGYFSPDFREHPLMQLMVGFFERHDRDRFEVHAFYFGPDAEDSAMNARMRAAVDHFHNVRNETSEAITQLARQCGLDIAMDLTGYTGSSRPGIFASRAAPVQINYMGFPGTLGASYWDYILADSTVLPEANEPYFAEKPLLMPDSYFVNDDGRAISDRVFTRQECGLPDDGFVFCCFNNNYKITPVEFDIWMRLLTKVEGSVLWLLKGSPEVEGNLRAEAQKRGVDPARLVFAERMKVPDHLARHRLADLFLDTFVVNAHTTACDALWAGLPVITSPGKGFSARVAASLLKAAGLEELIAGDHRSYEALALELALNPEKLNALKAYLRRDPASLALFDTERFTRHLERGYEEIVAIWQAGEAPRKIVL